MSAETDPRPNIGSDQLFDKSDWMEDTEVDHVEFNYVASAVAPIFVVLSQSLCIAKGPIGLLSAGFPGFAGMPYETSALTPRSRLMTGAISAAKKIKKRLWHPSESP